MNACMHAWIKGIFYKAEGKGKLCMDVNDQLEATDLKFIKAIYSSGGFLLQSNSN